MITKSSALIRFKEEALQHNRKIWYVARTAADINGILHHLGMQEHKGQFQHINHPDDLKGLKHPNVLILPNWWMKGYEGMEQMLMDTEANVVKV